MTGTKTTDHNGRLRAEQRRSTRWTPAARVTGHLRAPGAASRAIQVIDLAEHGARLWMEGEGAQCAHRSGEAAELELRIGGAVHRRTGVVTWVREDLGGVQLGFRFTAPEHDAPPPIVIDVESIQPDPRCALRLPAAQAMRRRVLPLCELAGRVVVACANVDDTAALHAVARFFDLPLQPQQVDADALLRLMRQTYGEHRGQTHQANDDPVALCNELLYAAWLRRASDIHINPEKDSVTVRFRVDGELEPYRQIPREAHSEVLSRIKVLAGMDIAEKRAPQDGRFTHEYAHGRRVDIRVATLPTNHGERATLRLLAIDTESLTLDNLGLLPDDLALCSRCLDRPHGLIVATGPTGCGKTTTLFAALRGIVSRRNVNVIAVQEPVEYDFAGISQVEVDPGRKVSFASALRAIMRHDPDVIMIGEIRDLETAGIAIKAALTGHLVLATLHTNSAASTITRLVDMGVERYLLASTLRLVLAQRLVRRLCPACRRPAAVPKEAVDLLRRPDFAGPVFAAEGCVYCAGTGFHGRLGLFELLPVDERMASAIRTGADEAELRTILHAEGRPALVDDAIEKLRAGTTALPMVVEAIA